MTNMLHAKYGRDVLTHGYVANIIILKIFIIQMELCVVGERSQRA
jgi:hypothetical protein